jgi:hypothetical protein
MWTGLYSTIVSLVAFGIAKESFLLSTVGLSAKSHDTRDSIEIRVDPRIELTTIVFRLAGAEEYAGNDVPRYAAAVDSFFGGHKNHSAVAMARQLREKRGIGWDAVMQFAVRLGEFPQLADRPRANWAEVKRGWDEVGARGFAEEMRRFARDTHADRFFAQQQPLIDTSVRRMRSLITRRLEPSWVPQFYGARPGENRWIVSVGLLNGSISYGVQFVPEGGAREIYGVIGAREADSAGFPVFALDVTATVVHEFSHSLVDPLLERHNAIFRPHIDSVAAVMSRQPTAQGRWEPRTLLAESLIRAIAARHVLASYGVDSAYSQLGQERLNAFVWIDDLFALLGAYEGARSAHPSFESFLPLIAAAYADIAPRTQKLYEQLDERRPRVVATSPKTSSNTVDPRATTLSITFDRAMRSTYSIAPAPDSSRGRVPEVLSSSWDSSGKVFTFAVRLEPHTTYTFSLNNRSPRGFASRSGALLKPIVITFKTGAKK